MYGGEVVKILMVTRCENLREDYFEKGANFICESGSTIGMPIHMIF